MKILLPLDIVQPVKPIVDEVVSLFQLAAAEVRLLFVEEALPAYESVVETAGNFPEDWRHQVEAKARTGLTEAERLLKPYCSKVSSEIVRGPAAMMIETVARDENCDVTVLTPKSHTVPERLFLGTVSSKVVKHGPGTIVICRPKKSSNERLQVVVGLDGSKNSKLALQRSLELFNLRDATVRLVHAVDVADPVKFLTPVEFVARIENNLTMEGETFLADGNRILNESGYKDVHVVLHKGDPAKEVIKLASESSANLVVIGARGHNDVQHFLLGSVSHRIAIHAPCTVAVVK